MQILKVIGLILMHNFLFHFVFLVTICNIIIACVYLFIKTFLLSVSLIIYIINSKYYYSIYLQCYIFII